MSQPTASDAAVVDTTASSSSTTYSPTLTVGSAAQPPKTGSAEAVDEVGPLPSNAPMTSPALNFPRATRTITGRSTNTMATISRRESRLIHPVAIIKAVSHADECGGCEVKLSQSHKWSLLALFSLAMFVDIWSYSAFFIFTVPITKDLDVEFAQQSWVITSYAVTFSAFLLFWGRVSDLYSAKPVFAYGFAALGVLDLIISFLPEKYSFFIFRALSGIAGACLIPAAFRLIVAIFEPEELGKAFTLFGSSGALANVTGVIIAGFFEYVPDHGQSSGWRWFFRLLAIMIIPASVLGLVYIPAPKGAAATSDSKFKRLDLVGSGSMLSAIVLLILGLTLGASNGWKTAGFLAPFLLSWCLFIFFFIWEAYIPQELALLPSATWKIPNFAMFIVFALYIYGWWAINFLPFVETFVIIHGEKPIIAAVRVLPEGVAAILFSVVLTVFPILVSRPRWPITIGMVLALVGLVLFAQSKTQIGTDYWRYLFPGFVLGSGGMITVFTGTNVGLITSVPPEMAGVAGAMLQVALQVGSAVALSVQAGLLTINPGSLGNFENVQASFYFQLGWGILWLIMFLVWYRQKPNEAGDEEKPPVVL